jgi:hypothetical protein
VTSVRLAALELSIELRQDRLAVFVFLLVGFDLVDLLPGKSAQLRADLGSSQVLIVWDRQPPVRRFPFPVSLLFFSGFTVLRPLFVDDACGNFLF